MIDIHCHVLPKLDDGTQSLDEALALARASVADGVAHVVATPHIYPGRYENTLASITPAFTQFRHALAVFRIPLHLTLAGEVRLVPELPAMLARGDIPFLGQCPDYRTMLLELPDAALPNGVLTLISRLCRDGVRPVLVHPERNKLFMAHPARICDFADIGCFIQLTAGSLLGQFGPGVLQASRAMIDHGVVNAVASDAHNLAGRRPRMREARQWLEQHFGAGMAVALTQTGPAALLGLPPASPHG